MERQPDYMYLTHFGRVAELARLAADMRDGVEHFVGWGEQFAADEQRRERIEEAMMNWLIEGARNHGVSGAEEKLRDIFAADVVLNTQGIEFWLDHGR